MKFLNTILKAIYTLPQILLHKLRGVDIPHSHMLAFLGIFHLEQLI